MTKKEKFNNLNPNKIDIKVLEYLKQILSNLNIEILNKYQGSLFNLMNYGHLEGWCWQTTESAILFFNDDDYIERGYLYLDKDQDEYYHSWICFKYDNKEYIFDPCLILLSKKEDYIKLFNANVKGIVTAKEVKEELIKQVTASKKEEDPKWRNFFDKFYKSELKDKYDEFLEKKKNEITVHGPEDVNTPFYRNGAGYKVDYEGSKIKKLTVHYYYTDC